MKILIIEDDPTQLKILKEFFQSNDFMVYKALNGEEGLELFKQNPIDIVITDYRMPRMNGKEVLKKIVKINPLTAVIIITAYSNVDDAVELIKTGAFDYIKKPINLDILLKKVRNASNYIQTAKDHKSIIAEFGDENLETNYIFDSPQMSSVMSLVRRISHIDAAVLISGESGTGKEVIVEIIHKLSPRKDNKLVTINCSAIPESLFESELFGHKKGAFTGAVKDRTGRFELANDGFLFLDEIADMPLTMQVKLLRAIENKKFEPVGSSETKTTNARIISATNKDLQKEVENGNFRQDLYYRLNVIPIHIPPLRERKEDIPKLIQYFLHRFETGDKFSFSKEAMIKMVNYSWLGNIRELRNRIRRITAFARYTKINVSDLPDEIVNYNPDEDFNIQKFKSLNSIEKTHITKILKECRGNQIKAAKILGIHRNTLSRKLKKYNID
ncbi:MAG: sigma-54 dependent transcriptional regulator [Candidatus Cloacimonadota bacterium]|nr:sigma-54 dependent transcriptional regulator [Candidatus Cloacimonadota bacterium]